MAGGEPLAATLPHVGVGDAGAPGTMGAGAAETRCPGGGGGPGQASLALPGQVAPGQAGDAQHRRKPSRPTALPTKHGPVS